LDVDTPRIVQLSDGTARTGPHTPAPAAEKMTPCQHIFPDLPICLAGICRVFAEKMTKQARAAQKEAAARQQT